MSSLNHKLDGRLLTRDEANLLLIELKDLPRGLEAKTVATLIKLAIDGKTTFTLTAAQTETVCRALHRLRLKRQRLSTGLAALQHQLDSRPMHPVRPTRPSA